MLQQQDRHIAGNCFAKAFFASAKKPGENCFAKAFLLCKKPGENCFARSSLFSHQQGRHSIVSSALFLLLVIAASTTTLLAYATPPTTPECPVACHHDADCDDKIATTIDVCNNDATCQSYCSNIVIQPPCVIACKNDSGCDDSNPKTIDVCNNDATCQSYCSNIAVQPQCSIACSSDSGCDDGNPKTIDVCNNDGACESYCTNTAIQPQCSIACSSDSGCDDSDSATVDVCSNDGACESYCTNALCAIACHIDAGCDDSDSATVDVCSNDGACESYCTNALQEAEEVIIIESVSDENEFSGETLIGCVFDGTTLVSGSPEFCIAEETGQEVEETLVIESTQADAPAAEMSAEEKARMPQRTPEPLPNREAYRAKKALDLNALIAKDKIFAADFFRKDNGIFLDTTSAPKIIGGQNISLKWGYDQEEVAVPYKFAEMPFWFEHNLPFAIDPCAGDFYFVSSYQNSGIQFLWDHNVVYDLGAGYHTKGKWRSIEDFGSCPLAPNK